MNAIAAISESFLNGKSLSIKTAFRDFGITNLPRECGRSIERKFGVKLERLHLVGQSRYGIPCNWTEYRLPNTEYNAKGREAMQSYVNINCGALPSKRPVGRPRKELVTTSINNTERLF